jgi:hypothetical protein
MPGRARSMDVSVATVSRLEDRLGGADLATAIPIALASASSIAGRLASQARVTQSYDAFRSPFQQAFGRLNSYLYILGRIMNESWVH